MTRADLEMIAAARPKRPRRWFDYVFEDHQEMAKNGTLWREFPTVIPFALVDERVADLAMSFWENPDDRLLKGYRRLEDIVRKRTGIDAHGQKLFAQAFAGDDATLRWKSVDRAEVAGRASLFTAAYLAYRNPRAHREADHGSHEVLAEFLLLNHLYRLEK